ncbi:SURF1 family protein [Aliiglaciecola sp. 3_MG-2023]|uniref:SURF1 family protein n=1 Tax=Aliiglaciecola sp. 3_MG-2023 TaxID=3062644 RepID=UPI0026E48171|nr:SURF1 family protein [Aliiglaciecola sp. 3_MG-2023]MDO6694354.1 SURF1 family protein [Aliiglaciecola sp. 3_MG-2023]
MNSSKHPYFATFLVLLAVAILCSLGVWQLQRGHYKTDRIQQIELRKATTPLNIEDILERQDKRDLPLEFKGRMLVNKIFLLDNRIENGQVGFHVLVPVRTEFGVVITNLGWVKGGQYRNDLPKFDLPTYEQVLFGTSWVPTVNPMVTETAQITDSWPVLVQSIDLTLMSKFLGTEVLPMVLQLDPAFPIGFSRHWVPVVMAPEKHYGYAIQWFALAMACFVIYVVALRKRNAPKDV